MNDKERRVALYDVLTRWAPAAAKCKDGFAYDTQRQVGSLIVLLSYPLRGVEDQILAKISYEELQEKLAWTQALPPLQPNP